jgi:hypothetical protein
LSTKRLPIAGPSIESLGFGSSPLVCPGCDTASKQCKFQKQLGRLHIQCLVEWSVNFSTECARRPARPQARHTVLATRSLLSAAFPCVWLCLSDVPHPLSAVAGFRRVPFRGLYKPVPDSRLLPRHPPSARETTSRW